MKGRVSRGRTFEIHNGFSIPPHTFAKGELWYIVKHNYYNRVYYYELRHVREDGVVRRLNVPVEYVSKHVSLGNLSVKEIKKQEGTQ